MPPIPPLQLIEEYKSRINRVQDFIEKNLDNPFSLEQLSDIACFSKFHFHRIFYALMGETLFQFIQRLRIEKAGVLLCYHSRKTITEVANECGFTDPSAFARAFKAYYGLSAKAWRAKHTAKSNLGTSQSNSHPSISNKQQSHPTTSLYNCTINQLIKRRNLMETKVEVKQFETLNLVYVRHIGPYQGNSGLFEGLFGKLCGWAGPRGLLANPDHKFVIIYHDNPEITDEDKLRVSVCLTVPARTPVDGEIGYLEIPAGWYGVGTFLVGHDGYGPAWNQMYADWLPASGYQPDDRPCFELYLPDCKKEGDKTEVSICIPVKYI